ncbi:MAG: succinate--CoA ligase subunit alpha [Nitrososphaerales archaeon]
MVDIFDILQGEEGDRDYKKKPIIVQGITGKFGTFHTKLMMEYGSNVAAGVTPGKGGQQFDGVPVYDTVAEALKNTGAKISVMFVPAPFFLDAAKEALSNGISLLAAIPEHVPIRDSLKCVEIAKANGATIIGPNTPGIIVPNVIKLGIMPAQPFQQGNVAVFSRSGTLMYEVSHILSTSGFGQKISLGIGGDPINCTTLIECFDMVSNRTDVSSVVVVGEIGGDAEEQLAEYIISAGFSKPVVAYIAGRSAPKEKRMGHAGAIIYGNFGSAESKVEMFAKASVPVAKSPAEVPVLLAQKLKRKSIS